MAAQGHDKHARLADRVARARDRDAFAALFNHFAPRLNGYLQKLGCSPEMAEEIAQDAMSALWHKAHLFDPKRSSLSTWLYRVARNRRIDLARRDRSHLLDPDDPLLSPEPAEAADDIVDADQRDVRVREALSLLPQEQVMLIREAFFMGRTHSEIAETQGLPLGTVKSRIRLAFNRLRKALDADPRVDTD